MTVPERTPLNSREDINQYITEHIGDLYDARPSPEDIAHLYPNDESIDRSVWQTQARAVLKFYRGGREHARPIESIEMFDATMKAGSAEHTEMCKGIAHAELYPSGLKKQPVGPALAAYHVLYYSNLTDKTGKGRYLWDCFRINYDSSRKEETYFEIQKSGYWAAVDKSQIELAIHDTIEMILEQFSQINYPHAESFTHGSTFEQVAFRGYHNILQSFTPGKRGSIIKAIKENPLMMGSTAPGIASPSILRLKSGEVVHLGLDEPLALKKGSSFDINTKDVDCDFPNDPDCNRELIASAIKAGPSSVEWNYMEQLILSRAPAYSDFLHHAFQDGQEREQFLMLRACLNFGFRTRMLSILYGENTLSGKSETLYWDSLVMGNSSIATISKKFALAESGPFSSERKDNGFGKIKPHTRLVKLDGDGTAKGDVISSSFIKQITGDDFGEASDKGIRDATYFYPYGNVTWAMNHLPRFDQKDQAIRARCIIVLLDNSFLNFEYTDSQYYGSNDEFMAAISGWEEREVGSLQVNPQLDAFVKKEYESLKDYYFALLIMYLHRYMEVGFNFPTSWKELTDKAFTSAGELDGILDVVVRTPVDAADAVLHRIPVSVLVKFVQRLMKESGSYVPNASKVRDALTEKLGEPSKARHPKTFGKVSGREDSGVNNCYTIDFAATDLFSIDDVQRAYSEVANSGPTAAEVRAVQSIPVTDVSTDGH
jgi:hypothetical protein